MYVVTQMSGWDDDRVFHVRTSCEGEMSLAADTLLSEEYSKLVIFLEKKSS